MTKPIRVLNLFTIMNRGGAETMVMNYYRSIDRSKVQFDFMVHREEKGAYDDEIEELGGKIYRMPSVRPWSSSNYRKTVRDFYHEHPEYNIIHSHMSELGYYDFVEAKKEGVKNRISHAHNRPYGIDIKSPMRWYYKKRMRPYVTHMMICGEEAGIWLFGKENKDKFIMLNNAIDSSKYIFDESKRLRVRKSLGIDPQQLVIGHVGRFDVQKNHSFIIDIFNAVLKRNPQAVLTLIGDDSVSLGQKIHEKADILGISSQVKFLGVRNDVNELMQAMDVFLFPSLFEGLSVASIEAQASGLPVIISDQIPLECKKTDLVEVVSLKSPVEKWADTLISASEIPRQNMFESIKKSGFDINENAKNLQNFYLSISK